MDKQRALNQGNGVMSYIVAVAATAVAVLVRWFLDPWLGNFLPLTTMFGAVAVTVYVGGYRPALLTTVLGFLVCTYMFMEPRGSLGPHGREQWAGLIAYLLSCGLIIGFGEALHRARNRVLRERARVWAERERFRLAADAVNGIIYEYDVTSGTVVRTRGLYEVLGYQPDEVPPTTAWWHEQIHPEDRQDPQSLIEHGSANGSITTQYRLRHKDGHWIQVEDRSVILRNDAGNPLKLVGCTVDMTARHEAEQELRHREAFTSGVLGSITDGFYALNADWRFTFVNDELVKRIGLPREEIVGQNIWELFPLAVGNPAYLQLHRAMTDRVTVEYEVFYEPWRLWLLGKAFPTSDGGLAVYTRDITERKQAEESRRESEERFRGIFDQTTAGFAETDLTGQFVRVNQQYCKMVGRSDMELQGLRMQDITHPDDLPHNEILFARAVTDGTPFVIEKRYVRPSGASIWVSNSVSPIKDAFGRTRSLVAALLDITDRKQAEAVLAGQKDILEMIATGRPLPEILDAVCRLIEGLQPGLICSLLLPDEERRFTKWAFGPSLPDSYLRALEGLRIAEPDIGGCGETLDNGKVVVVQDVETEEKFSPALRQLLIDHGLRSCRSIPVFDADGSALASFALYRREPGNPDSSNEGLIIAATHLSGIAISRKLAEDRLRERERQLATVLDQLPVGVGVMDLDGRMILDNPIMHRFVPDRLPSLDHERRSRWRAWKPDGSPLAPNDWPGQRAIRGEAVIPGDEFLFTEDDGREVWTSVATAPLREASGAVTGIVVVVEDIDIRKRTAERLRESEERFRLVVESAQDYAIFTVDLTGHVTGWNSGAKNLLGYDEAEVIGQPGDFVYTPEARAIGVPERELETARTRGRAENESWHVRKDGSRFWASGLVMPMRDDGQLVGFVKVMRDRTEARLAEDKFRRVVQSEMVGILFWGTDGTISDANDTFLKMVGYDRADLATGSLRWTDLIPPEYSEVEKQALREIEERGSCTPFPKEYIRKDGSRLPVLIGGAMLGEGVNEGVAFVADMTERRRQEVERDAIQGTLSTLIERCPFGIYIVDADFRIANVNAGSQAGAFRNVRPVIGRMFDEALRIIWPEPLASELIRIFRHTLDTGEPYYSTDFVNPRADTGQTEGYEWEIHRIMMPDGRYGVVCYYYDSTRLRQAERALREADQKKDEFLATLAHELRNPLAPLRNGLQIMKLAQSDPKAVETVRIMMDRQVGQMAHLIDDLMDLSRISRGKIVLQKTRLRLSEAVQDAVDASRPLIEERRHELRLDLPSEPIFVDADPTRLTQIFGNLLNNAAKYTEKEGRIRLIVERQRSDVVVMIEDNGIGIPVPMLPKAFDMFTQIDRSLEKSQGGLGIGLNIVKRLVEMHGGSIEAHSEGHGAGSKFIVRLPVVHASTGDPPQRENSVVVPIRRRILVVDDNRDGAASLAEMLTIMGNETQIAHDGYEAVSLAEVFKPDVILMDIGMPKLNGYEACRSIREQPWGQSVVIVAQTGWGQDDDKKKSLEAGLDLHMVKPVDPAELEKLLARPKPSMN